MQSLRASCIRSSLLLLTLLLFINLSFLQTEVVLLKLNQHTELKSYLTFLFNLTATEEQTETGESDNDSLTKEIDLMFHHTQRHQRIGFDLNISIRHLKDDTLYNHDFLKKFSPPPEC